MDFKQFCIKWAKEIVNSEKAISLGHKNEQLYAICCALAMDRAYKYETSENDVWHFPCSHIDDLARHYYDAFIEKDEEKLKRMLEL